jgi:hypothetical protein
MAMSVLRTPILRQKGQQIIWTQAIQACIRATYACDIRREKRHMWPEMRE